MKEKIVEAEDRKVTNTAFILMFPTLIIAAVAIAYAPIIVSMISIALTVYQFLMTKKFIQDYYKK